MSVEDSLARRGNGLVLRCKPGERIVVGENIVITLVDSRDRFSKLGISAPQGVDIQREKAIGQEGEQ